MEVTPGVYSMSQQQGGHVHAFLLDDGNGLTLIDTLYDDDGNVVLAELQANRQDADRLEAHHPVTCAQIARRRRGRPEEGQQRHDLFT